MREQRVKLTGAATRGQMIENAIIKRSQSDCVALLHQKKGERCGEGGGVFALRITARAVAHRSARIEQQLAAEVSFLLELLHEPFVAARGDLPVHEARIIAADIGPIL